jgi:hypothetical protein
MERMKKTDLLQSSQKRLHVIRNDSNDNLNDSAEYLDNQARQSFILICWAKMSQVGVNKIGEKSYQHIWSADENQTIITFSTAIQ